MRTLSAGIYRGVTKGEALSKSFQPFIPHFLTLRTSQISPACPEAEFLESSEVGGAV